MSLFSRMLDYAPRFGYLSTGPVCPPPSPQAGEPGWLDEATDTSAKAPKLNANEKALLKLAEADEARHIANYWESPEGRRRAARACWFSYDPEDPDYFDFDIPF